MNRGRARPVFVFARGSVDQRDLDLPLNDLDCTSRNHFGFMRPKSVRRLLRSFFLGSKTQEPEASRANVTQCQAGPDFSRCHLIASSARSGKESQDTNDFWLRAEILNSSRSRRTYVVLLQSCGSLTSIPSRRAACLTSAYVRFASAATLAIPQPVRSS